MFIQSQGLHVLYRAHIRGRMRMTKSVVFMIAVVAAGNVRYAESAVAALHQHGRPAGGVGQKCTRQSMVRLLHYNTVVHATYYTLALSL